MNYSTADVKENFCGITLNPISVPKYAKTLVASQHDGKTISASAGSFKEIPYGTFVTCRKDEKGEWYISMTGKP